MNKIILSLVGLLMIFLAGCSINTLQTENQNIDSKPLILTTFYPVEEITKVIVEDTAEVKVLVGIGVEPHSFEPSPSQIVEFSKADVFVTMEGLFEHAEKEIIEANSNIKIIESAHNLELIKGDTHDHEHSHEEEEHAHEDEHEEESHDNHDLGDYDPHVWLSIHNMEKMTNEILENLVEIYPENKELYETNAQAYLDNLEVLEEEFENKLNNCEHDVIIVNHKAFGYLGHEYSFEQISIAGFSPESEPSPKTIQTVIDEAKKHNLSYIFSEGQLDKKTAQTIANDIEGEVLELNPLRLDESEDYFSIMRDNLNNLVLGLNCQ